jgi:hypothetical protein
MEGGKWITLDNGGPSLGWSERGGFIRALLGGEDWTGLDGTDPGRG